MLTIAARDMVAGAQEPAAAALLGLGVLREVLPPQRAEADVSHNPAPALALTSSGHLLLPQTSCSYLTAVVMVSLSPRTIASCMLSSSILSSRIGIEFN